MSFMQKVAFKMQAKKPLVQKYKLYGRYETC